MIIDYKRMIPKNKTKKTKNIVNKTGTKTYRTKRSLYTAKIRLHVCSANSSRVTYFSFDAFTSLRNQIMFGSLSFGYFFFLRRVSLLRIL